MAATATLLTSNCVGFYESPKSSKTTASISPGANCALVLMVSGMNEVVAGDWSGSSATSSGSGPSWTRAAYANGASGSYHAGGAIYTAVIGGTDPGSFTVTFTLDNMIGCQWALWKVTGHDTSTTFAGAAATTASTGGNGAKTLTLAATPNSGDAVLAFAFCDTDGKTGGTFGSGGTWTEDADFASGYSQGFGGGNAGHNTTLTSTSVNWSDINTSYNTNYSYFLGGIIVKQAGGGSTPVSSSDTGSGAEGTPTLSTSRTATETGAGADSSSVSATTSSTDSGSGAEGTPKISVSSSDSGSGTEGTPAIAATVAGSDTGSGSEGTPAVAATTSSSDTGSGTEGAATVSAALSSSDTGSGTEGQSLDTGGSGTVDKSSSDTGTGTEGAPSIAATLSSSDTGSGAEAITLSATVTGSDSGSGTEGTPGVALGSADAGSGTEGATTSATTSSSDSGSGTDAGSVSASLSSTDTGTGTDDGSVWDTSAVAPPDDGRPTKNRPRSRGGLRQRPTREVRIGYPAEPDPPLGLDDAPLTDVAVPALARRRDDELLLLL